MEIHVTTADIEQGKGSNCVSCPVALALRRYNKRLLANVPYLSYVKPVPHISPAYYPEFPICKFPSEVLSFIESFDDWYPLKYKGAKPQLKPQPFSFHLSAECLMD